MRIACMKHITWYLIFAMFIIGIAPRVDAGIAPSEIISLAQTDRAADIEKIQKFIETKMVKERLVQYGFSQDEIQQKLDSLSDQQIHNFALQLDDMKVGGDLGIIVVLLVIVILVVILLQLTGHRVVVTK